MDVIEEAITRHNSDSTTKAMALVALLKLSSRFPSISEYVQVCSTSLCYLFLSQLVHLISALIHFQLYRKCICALSI